MSEYDHQPIWHARRDGHVRGPFTSDELRRYLLLGRIRLEDELSRDGVEWRPVSALPHVIPEEMRDVRTAADRRRLNWARAQVDERSGGDRRLGAQRLAPPVIERRGPDRRRPEDPQLVWFRTLYQWLFTTRQRWRYAGWFGMAAVAILLFA